MTKDLSIKPSTLDILFRIGLSSFFLINSLTAWFSPNEFLELLGMNSFISTTGNPQFWIYFIGINDALLFLLILSGRWRKGIATWAGLWVLTIIYITISKDITEFIEHIGVLSFILYYYFTFERTSVELLK